MKKVRTNRRLTLESLEERLVPAVVTWDAGGDGQSWHDARNWSRDLLPGTADSVVIGQGTTPVRYSDGATQVQSVQTSRPLELLGGSLTTQTGLTVTTASFLYGSGQLAGPVKLINSRLTLGDGGTGAVSFVVYGESSTLSGKVHAGQSITLQTDYGHSTKLTAADGTINEGLIILDSTRNDRYSQLQTTTGAVFTNGAGGTIRAEVGGGGGRYLRGALVNAGAVQAQAGTRLDFRGEFTAAGGRLVPSGDNIYLTDSIVRVTASPAEPTELLLYGATALLTDNLANTTLRVKATYDHSPTLTAAAGVANRGVILLDSPRNDRHVTLRAADGGTFTNTEGGVIEALAGGGQRYLRGAIVNRGRVVARPGITLDAAGPFSLDAGSLDGQGSITHHDGAFVFRGGTTSGTIALVNDALTIEPTATAAAGFRLYGGTTAAGELHPGQTLTLTTNYDHNSVLTADGFRNSGTIVLDSTRNDRYSQLQTTTGAVFTNTATGVVMAAKGGGGKRYLRGGVVNEGKIEAAAGINLDVRGDFTAAGGRVVAHGDNVYLVNSQIAVTASPPTATTLLLYGGNRMMTDNLANTVLRVLSSYEFNSTLTVPDGFENAGVIRLDSPRNDRTTTLTSPGTLTNQDGGLIDVVRGGGGGRALHGALTNRGALNVQAIRLTLPGSVRTDGSGVLAVQEGGSLHVAGNVVGATTNAERFGPVGWLTLNGRGTAAQPQLLEVAGKDRGGTPIGYVNNFALVTLAVAANTYVRLVDEDDNAAGQEALYVSTLDVPRNATLDLNGHRLYARTSQIQGMVVGGTVSIVDDGGELPLEFQTVGFVRVAGEVDRWTFAAGAGQSFRLIAATAPATPPINHAQIRLVSPGGQVLATATNEAEGGDVVLAVDALPVEGVYHLLVEAAPGRLPTGRYTLTGWVTTPRTHALSFNESNVGQIDGPAQEERWRFSAQAGDQIRLDLGSSAFEGLRFDLIGPDGVTVFQGLSADSEPFTLSAAGAYVLSAYSVSGTTGAYSFKLMQVNATALTPVQAAQGQLTASGQYQLFKVEVTESTPLRFLLDDASSANRNEVYVRYGLPPTRGTYQYRSDGLARADQEVLVPLAAPGTWYVLVYSESVREAGTFTLTARVEPMQAIDLTPDRASDRGEVVVTLTGAGFDPTTTLTLRQDDMMVAPRSMSVDSPTRISATFASLPAGTYEARVTNRAGVFATLADALTVVSGGRAELQTRLTVPSAVGYGGTATITLEYTNAGDIAMPAPLLMLTATQNGRQGARLTLDAARVKQGVWTSANPDGASNTILLLGSGQTPGLLQPGETVRVPVYYVGWERPWDFSFPPIQFQVSAITSDDTRPMGWDTLGPSLRPAGFDTAAWGGIVRNLRDQIGSTWGDYVRMLHDNMVYLGRLGEPVIDIGDLFAFEVQQASTAGPFAALARSVDAVVNAPGLALTFSRTFQPSLAGRYEVGALGRGWRVDEVWQSRLEVSGDGTVIIHGPGGSARRFQPDVRGGYFSETGDHGRLLLAGGRFSLAESDGLTLAYNADGTFAALSDPNGNRISAEYAGGRLTRVSHTSGQALAFAYSTVGRLASVTDLAGRRTAFTYDASGEHLLSVTDPEGRVTAYSYDLGDDARTRHLLRVVDAPEGEAYFAYDSRGRLTSLSPDDTNPQLTLAYDSAGGVSLTTPGSASAPPGTSILYFDHRGLLLKTQDALGRTTRQVYDAAFNLVQATDAAGRTTDYTYDRQGRLTSIFNPLGQLTTFGYGGPFDRLTSFTDARGNSVRYQYDASGNLTETVYADGSVSGVSVGSAGLPEAWTNRRGDTIRYSFDASGRITARTYDDGTVVTYAYDERGNLSAATDATGTTTLECAAGSDRMSKITYPGGRYLAFTYDAAGRRVSSVDQLGYRLEYRYDTAGRLEAVTDGTADLVRYRYDVAGRLVGKDLGNGVTTAYEYDAAGQLLHLVNRAPGGAVLSRFEYEYDVRGLVKSMITLEGRWSYEHDAVGQLVKWTSPDGRVVEYAYDAAGNRVTETDNGVVSRYTANALNQYTDVDGVVYSYDADGNLIRRADGDDLTTYTYDAENRLVGVSHGQDVDAYMYNALGQRVAATHNGTTTAYVVDPAGLGNVVGEYDGSGALVAHYDHGYGLVSQHGPAGSGAFYTFNMLGSTSEVTGAAGQVLTSYQYEPFGAVSVAGAAHNPFQFVGEHGLMQAEGLTFMRARHVDAGLGRFTTMDPLSLGGGDENLYRYVSNNPLDFVDLNGLWSVEISGFAGYIVGVSGSVQIGSGGIQGTVGVGAAMGASVGIGVNTNSPGGNGGIGGAISGAIGVVGGTIGYGGGGGLSGGVSVGLGGGAFIGPTFTGPVWNPWAGPPSPTIPVPPYNLGDAFGGVPIPPVAAFDPNQLTGPAGIGTQHYVAPGSSLPYRIDFENDATATAPAQRVTLSNFLSPDLDWSTFELTDFGFGDTLIRVPAGRQHYQTALDVTIDDRSFRLDIELGLHSDTGEVFAVFQSIDPATDLPPDVLTGFLPPEDGTGRGMGHVGYVIRAKMGLPNGTEVRNIASITFDFNPAITTDQVDPHDPSKGVDPAKQALVTIDAGAPTSRVLPLFAAMSPSFTVSWAGSDAGAGVASYDVYVSADGGPFERWLQGVTATSATYDGALGHTYSFYSIATDLLGNVEVAQPVAQTVRVFDSALTLRRNGDTVELVDTARRRVVATRPMDDPTPLVIQGSDTKADKLTVSFAEGALSLPGGIRFDAGADAGDQLVLIGKNTAVMLTTGAVETFTVASTVITASGIDAQQVSGFQALTIDTVGGDDSFTVARSSAGQNVISGTGLAPLTFLKVTSLTLDVGTGDGDAAVNSVTVNGKWSAAGLRHVTILGGAGSDRLTHSAPSLALPARRGTYRFNGGPGTDTVAASGNGNWTLSDTSLSSSGGGKVTIADVGQGVLVGGAGRNVLDVSRFSGSTWLTGGAGKDVFKGGAGYDWIVEAGNVDFALTDARLSGAGIDVLSRIDGAILTGGAGDNLINAATFSGKTVLSGGAGNDTLRAGAGASVLLGGDGGDLLEANRGRDLVFGGAGADLLSATGTNDVLIHGMTAFDANAEALLALLAEWERTDLPYTERIWTLREGGPLDVFAALTDSVIVDDRDRLEDGRGDDWFWASLTGDLSDGTIDRRLDEFLN